MTTKNGNRLKAFTLMETLMALVLTSILIALIYAGIRRMHHYLIIVKKQTADSSEFHRFQHAIYTDAYRANALYCLPQGIRFILPDTEVEYTWQDSIGLRQTSLDTDTFQVTVNEQLCWFFQEPVSPKETAIAEVSHISTNHKHRHVTLSINQQYDAETLIRLTSAKNE